MAKYALILLLLSLSFSMTVAQPQTRDSIIIKQRVIETMQTNYINDTAVRYRIVLHYKYSGKRGSTFRPLDMQPGLGYGYQRFRNVWEEAEFAHLPEPFFNAYREDVQYDTVYDYQYEPKDTTSQLFKYKTYENDSALKIGSEALSLLSTSIVEREIIRDGSGIIRKIQCSSKYNNLPANNVLYTASLGYDNRGYISTDTLIRTVYADTFTKRYEHDSEGRITSVNFAIGTKQKPWQELSRHQYLYGSNGKLSTRIEEYKNQTGKWDTTYRRLEYDSLNRLTTFYTITLRTGKSDTNTISYHYDAIGDMDTMSLKDNNGTIFRHSYRYNQYHNPDTIWYYTIYKNGLQGQSRSMNVYTYEAYYDTLKIDVPTIKKPLVLYPNPAGSKVTIRWNKDHPHQAVNIFIHNIGGQVIRKYHLENPGAENSIDVSGLAQGIYTVAIRTLGGGKIYIGSLSIAGW